MRRYSTVFPVHHAGLIPLLKVKKKKHKDYIRRLLSLQIEFKNKTIGFWQEKLGISRFEVFDFPFEYPLVYLFVDIILTDIFARSIFDLNIYKEDGKIKPEYFGEIVSRYFRFEEETLKCVLNEKSIYYHSLEIPPIKLVNIFDMLVELYLFVSYDENLVNDWRKQIYKPFKELDNLRFLFPRVLGMDLDIPFEIITKDEDIFILPLTDGFTPLNENVEPVFSEIQLI